MQVFKFGGASVKDAEAVKNVVEVLKQFPNEKLCIVISAMGKTTNHLERLAKAYFYASKNSSNPSDAEWSKSTDDYDNPETILEEIKEAHFSVCNQLFPNSKHPIYTDLENTFVELHWAIEDEPTQGFDFEYDQIVSIGEVLSTKIVSAYLNENGITNIWLDARGIIQTDNTYREGKVDFELTENMVKSQLEPALNKQSIIVTQGFIGGTSENFTTTLGREGSDYTASILAYCLNAKNVTIWKDVPGVLNADPKYFKNTKKIDELTYQDAIELTYYGASVIHPKTIKPLQNKQIPLYVKSFLNPKAEGTVIKESDKRLNIPSYIFKLNQLLISIQPKDFSFIAEDNLSDIFELFAKHGVKINLMQLSAISFSICCDDGEQKVKTLITDLQQSFKVLYNNGVELMTIRYYTQETIDVLTQNKTILLEQRSRFTVQMVIKTI